MSTYGVPTRRWTRKEYGRLIDVGILQEDDPIELVDGELVVREPQVPSHSTATLLVAEALRTAFGRGWHVRSQLPVALDDSSEPEPDVSVVKGDVRTYRTEHPARPVLIVEVADTSLRFDRRRKGGVYARAGIKDYWIVNLGRRVLEVYRQPIRSAEARYGYRYRSLRLLKPGVTVTPLAVPAGTIPVAELFP